MTLSESINQVFIESNFDNFPSGIGSWNNSNNYKEDGNLFNSDQLMDLLKDRLSIWNQNQDISEDILKIKNDIISSRMKKTKKCIKKSFNILRIVDKNIVNVDSRIKEFENLESLILSLNFIDNINSSYLPDSLKVLELYGNKMEDLKFVQDPNIPGLHHLGVGKNSLYNAVPLSESFVLHDTLVSLDLSLNYLSDLIETVDVLCNLKHLKILILAGNPLSLICVYRGYVIDCIKSLTMLDDKIISADERYSVRAMKTKAENVKSKCHLTIAILAVKNIIPKEITKDPTEEPLIKIDYFLTFKFPFQTETMIEAEQLASTDIKTEDEIPEIIEETSSVIKEIRSQSIVTNQNELNFNWINKIPITDTLLLANTLNETLNIQLFEETKYLYSPENLPTEQSSRLNSQSSKRKPKSASKQKGGADKSAKKTGGDKKKKLDESKMVLHKSEVALIGEYHCDMSNLMRGAVKFDMVLPDILFEENKEDLSLEKNKEADRSNKTKKGNKEQRGKSAEKAHKSKETGGKHGKTPQPVVEEEPKKPSECSINVVLLNYSTTKSLNKIN